MKNVLLNVAFFAFEIVLMILLYVAIVLALDTFIFDLLNWFNGQNTFVKILLIIIGGVGLIYLILGIVQAAFLLITQPIFNKLPMNQFTGIIALFAFLLNTAILLYDTWSVVNQFSFWVVIELIMLSFIIISLNWSILANRRKTA